MTAQQTISDLTAIATRYTYPWPAQTTVPRLTIWSSLRPGEPSPGMFEPKFYILLQGAKRLTIAGKAYDLSAGGCAVSSVGLPFTSQVTEASFEFPYLGVDLRLDPGTIASLLLEMPDISEAAASAFSAWQVTEDVLEPLHRLLRLLDSPADIPILAPQIERELYYRLLQGPMGGNLRQVVQHNTRFHQIRTAVDWLCANAKAPMRVEALAASVGMSVTSFHRHFKAVTALSPLAYQRHLRLLHAQQLVASGAASVTAAAFATGYASASQFSREYKQMFGLPPARHAFTFRERAEDGRRPPLSAEPVR